MRRYRGPDCGDDFAQEFPQPLEDETQVVTDGAHDGVKLVAVAALEKVAPQMAVHLAMADDGFDGGSPPEFASDLAVNAAFLSRAEDPVWLWRIVAPVALVDIDPLDLAAGQGLGLLEHLLQGVAVVRIAGERLGMEDEPCPRT